MKSVSFVFPFYNRHREFYKTLESLHQFELPEEIIVVDDASEIPLEQRKLNEYHPNIKLITVKKEEKTWMNPCIPYNIGFKEASSDIVIISNPECYVWNDVVKFTKENLNKNDYFSYSCFSIPKGVQPENFKDFNEVCIFLDGEYGWYNHSVWRPQGSHYTSAIDRELLLKVGGMDERYANGIAWDDYGFQKRLRLNNINFRIVDDVIVLHQHHFTDDHESKKSTEEFQKLVRINMNIFNEVS